jgi:DNA-binding SARP family transcriptional activator
LQLPCSWLTIDPVEFRILGPLEVAENGHALRLGGRKQRALLALMLLHAGEVVARDRLIEELWHGNPPAAAETSLRAYLSRLRAILGAERVQTRTPGYLLALDPHELDAHRFEQLLAAGREALASGQPTLAVKPLRESLALWHGGALVDFQYEPFAQREIARLEELRLAAHEERIEAELALGLHGPLVAEIEALVAENPLRERLRRQLMLALYRSGRQAEALETFQRARRALTEELGLEPSETLKELQRAILAHAPSLEVAPPDRRSDAIGPFVGRETEQALLLAGLDDSLSGRARVILISGEPGIGKSRLAEELTAHARQRGARVLVGRCWEAGGAPAFWPWVQALRSYLRDRDPSELRRHLGEGGPHLAQILPELSELITDLPFPPPADPESARFQLFDATASFLRNASNDQPLVLVLDDLHAADTPSLLLLQFVVATLGESRLLVVAAFRDLDPTLKDPLAATLAELSREPGTRHLPLTGLGEQGVATFIKHVAGFDPPTLFVTAVHHQTEGNPLFVGEILRLLAAEGTLGAAATDEQWHVGVPEGVRAVIRRRVRQLSEECKLALALASVLGREFGLDALELASGVSREALLAVLDEAARERVVAEVPGAPARLRFAHTLIREVLYEELAPGRRAQLERRVGEALEALYGEDTEPHLAELAHHFYRAVPVGGADKAIDYSSRAGDRAAGLFAFEEAVRLYEMALAATSDDVSRGELLLTLGEAQARAGDTPASKTTFRHAAELAASQRHAEQLARAAIGYGGRLIWDVSRDDEYLVPLLERALGALGEEDNALRVRVMARLAGGPLRERAEDAGRRRSLGKQALEMGRRIGEPATLAYALHGYITSHLTPEFTVEQVETANELVRVALEAGDLERALEGYDLHLTASVELGEVTAARADLDAMTALADELHQPAQRWVVAVYQALFALLEGRFDEAETLIAETRTLGERSQSWNAVVTYGLQHYVLLREHRRLGEIEDLVRQAAATYPTYPIWRCVHADMLAELGSTAEARIELETVAAEDFAGIPFDEEWEVSLCFLAETASRLEEKDQAAALYRLLLPYADRVAISYPEISLGPISRVLGILASSTANWSDAEQHFEAALETSERIGARPFLAHTREGYARMLLERGKPIDAARAHDLCARARDGYRQLGLNARSATASALLASIRQP